MTFSIDPAETWDGIPAPAETDPFAGLPGHPLMWILILSELAVFTVAFLGIAATRWLDPTDFLAGQRHLDGALGGVNTMVLVTSGFLAAVGVASARDGRRTRARLLTIAAACLGSLFLVVKSVEYAAMLKAGLTLDSGGFVSLYFLLTGFHALHVVMGVAVLLIVARHDSLANLETGAAFWHMLDLVWVVLYPLMYLMR